MPFKPGHKRVPGSGRPKGGLNKDHARVHTKSKELGIDPFEVLLLFAAGDWKKLGYRSEVIEKISKDSINWEYTIAPAVRAKAAGEACQYLYPKKAAVQHEISPGEGEGSAFKVVVMDYTRKEEQK